MCSSAAKTKIEHFIATKAAYHQVISLTAMDIAIYWDIFSHSR